SDGDLVPRHADVLVGLTILASPFPHLVEHAAVKLAYEIVAEDLLLSRATERPASRVGDVRLFERVQLALSGDRRGNEPCHFVAIERGGAGGVRNLHGSSQSSVLRRALRSAAISSTCCSCNADGGSCASSAIECCTPASVRRATARARAST